MRDLFYATPARLKFMKSERSEAMAIAEEIKRQAMAHEATAFALDLDGRRTLRLPAETAGPEGRLARLSQIMGREFSDNALAIDHEREGVRLSGFAGLPTYNRGNAAHQYLFVNGRPVRDRLLQGALRAAYADFLARDRHPLAALYVELDTAYVDVNVHPAKAEVRFRDPALSARPDRRRPAPCARRRRPPRLDHGLHRGPGRLPARRLHTPALRSRLFRLAPGRLEPGRPRHRPSSRFPGLTEVSARAEPQWEYEGQPGVAEPGPAAPVFDPVDFPLGAARAQVHETYIVAQTRDGVVIVDQHAAHERLVYERMKGEMAQAGGVARQALLLPEVVELDPAEAERVAARGRRAGGAGPDAGALRPGRRPGPRDPGPAGRDGRPGPGPRHRRRPCRERPGLALKERLRTSAPPWPATARSARAAGSPPRR